MNIGWLSQIERPSWRAASSDISWSCGIPGTTFRDLLHVYEIVTAFRNVKTGIERRSGWSAINLWYITMLFGDTITMDEPASLPGDYVLLRALSDLVLAFSACPDDLDAANAAPMQPFVIRQRVRLASASSPSARAAPAHCPPLIRSRSRRSRAGTTLTQPTMPEPAA